MIEISEVASPLGDIKIATHGGALCGVGFSDSWGRTEAHLERRFPGVTRHIVATDPIGVAAAIADYFEGQLDALRSIPLDIGGTEFQRKVWEELSRVPAGVTVSYGDLAARIGSARAVRAVGSASGANPVCLVVPCHRMVRSNGDLGGYAGRLERKAWLLEHERKREQKVS